MGLLDWLFRKKEIEISDFDMGNKLFRRELATALNVTPLSLRRASQEYLHENRAVLKEVWDRIQAETDQIKSNANPIYPPSNRSIGIPKTFLNLPPGPLNPFM